MKQKKISRWLKAMILMLAVLGILFFGPLTCFAFQYKAEHPGSLFWTFIFFSWYTALLCYAVLIEFWKICTEIGRDNSFSMENATGLHRMGMCAVAAEAGFLARFLWFLLIHELRPWPVLLIVLEMLLCLIFVTLCEALSKLTQNAYEVKRENELTI